MQNLTKCTGINLHFYFKFLYTSLVMVMRHLYDTNFQIIRDHVVRFAYILSPFWKFICNVNSIPLVQTILNRKYTDVCLPDLAIDFN